MAFVEDVKAKATTYLGYEPKALIVDLAIDTFKSIRNYPTSYDDTKISADLSANINVIAYAIIEYDAKEGIEGQTNHNENGLNRAYGQSPIPKAYFNVIPFATVVK